VRRRGFAFEMKLRAALAGLACSLLVAGCALPAREPTRLIKGSDVAPIGFTADIRWTQETTRSDFERHAAWMAQRMRRASHGQALEVLAVSGGGANGAFGAGVLVGWSQTGSRPKFDVVTGVSAGALIAPLAFLGSDWDEKLTEAFAGRASFGLLQSRLLSALFGLSLFDGEPLSRLVDRYVTDDLLRAVAAESAKGRILLVATTNLDQQKLVIWDMGAIAARADAGGRELFREVLVASASIPGVFPPVLLHVKSAGQIYDEMHVDGGTKASLLAMPDIAAVVPHDMTPMHGANLYLLVNGKLSASQVTTPTDAFSVFKRALATSLNGEVRSKLLLAYAFAQRNDIELKVAALPSDFVQDDSLDFAPSRMKSLFDYGVRCANLDRVWGDALDVLDAAVITRPPSGAPDADQCPIPNVEAP
jgi:hypothetical protein